MACVVKLYTCGRGTAGQQVGGALVDDDLYPLVSAGKWYISHDDQRPRRKDGTLMQDVLFPGDELLQGNGDRTDLRRENVLLLRRVVGQ